MKKIITLLFLVFAVNSVSFSTDFKFGIGSGLFSSLDMSLTNPVNPSYSYQTWADSRANSLNISPFLFLDATYFELGIAFLSGFPVGRTDRGYNPESFVEMPDKTQILELVLLGKAPITLEQITLYPLIVGLGYRYVFVSEIKGVRDEKASEYNTLGLFLGLGTDFSLTRKIYLQVNLLTEIWFQSERSKTIYGDWMNTSIDYFYDSAGLRLKIGLVYYF